MIYFLLLFLFMTLLYVYISYRRKSLMNIMAFVYVNDGIIMVFLYTISLSLEGNYYNISQGDWLLLFYFFVESLGVAVIELNNVHIKTVRLNAIGLNNKIIFLMCVLVILYIGGNIDVFKLALTNPRMFYANTRIGGGFIYYIFVPCIEFLYFVYLIKFRRRSRFGMFFKYVVSTGIVILFLYLFGQKATIIKIAVLCITSLYFREDIKKKNRLVLLTVAGFCIVVLIVFALYSLQQNISVENIVISIAGYADYLKNFNLLVENLDGFYYGKIFVQDEFFSYIPRSIWAGKPKLFGSLALGLEVPELVEWTQALTGAPSFGPIGAAYADFGFIGICLKIIFNLFIFSIAKDFLNRLNRKYNFWDHLLFLAFTGYSIFSITLCTIPLYQIAVVAIMYSISKHAKKKSGVLKVGKMGNFV